MSADPLVLSTARDLFAAYATPSAVQAAEAAGWAPELWDALVETGLPWVGLPDEGGTLEDAFEVLRLAGRFAVPLPLAETMLAGWLVSSVGLPVGREPLTVAPPAFREPTAPSVAQGAQDLWASMGSAPRPSAAAGVSLAQGKLHGRVERVPWASHAGRIVLLVPDRSRRMVATVRPLDVRPERLTNLAGEPRETIILDGVTPDELAPVPAGLDEDALRLRGALTRATLMAGALERMSELTIEYTNQRRQFGRPVAAFQAVQIHVVNGAQDAALATMAAQQATAAAQSGATNAAFEIGSAKLLASEAAHSATRAAHQAHGAMGMTQDYALHHFSRRLWSWRAEYGDERYWSARLGRAVTAAPPERLYPAITAGSGVLEHV
ncbi:MAG: acyl-CoA dehydrogenase [Chloroflexi bacterium]|nr:acyl-CoA dehydrogenase [Chloroflexota bacterium]